MSSIQDNIRNSINFQLFPPGWQECITDKQSSLDQIKRVATTHKSDPSMKDYSFFERQMELAFWATDYWKEEYDSLSDEDKKFFDYIETIKP